MRVLRGPSPPSPLARRAPTACADDTSVGTRRGVDGGFEAAAECTCLSPASYWASFPTASAHDFGVFLHARGWCVGCAAQRSGTRCRSGRPRRRRSAAAPRRFRNGPCTRPCAAACPCAADGGGNSVGALRRFAASGNGAPVAILGVHVGVGIDERSDHSAIAVGRRPVQRGPAIAAHGGAGMRGGAPRGYPSPKPVPETQNSRLARGSTKGSFWVTVNDREYSERTRSSRHLAPRSRIHQTGQT
jgi:hypothetical protein